MADKDAVVIYDQVSWVDGDNDKLIRTALRGETVSLPQAEYDRLSDAKTHAPYGAVAEPGSSLAQHLSQPISGAEDPVAIRARLAAIKTDGPTVAVMLTDPAGRDVTRPVEEVDPGVSRSRGAPHSAEQTSARSFPAGSLDALDKGSLAKMAKALGVEVDAKADADQLRAALEAHVSGGTETAGETADKLAGDLTPGGSGDGSSDGSDDGEASEGTVAGHTDDKLANDK